MSAKRIDVSVDRVVAATPEQVAAVMFVADRDPTWMRALTSAQLLDPSMGVGAQVERHARFLGRDISWITTVRELEPPARLVLDIADGPFTGEIVYEIAPVPEGSRVTIRNVGTPGQFTWMPTALTRTAMRVALEEGPAASGAGRHRLSPTPVDVSAWPARRAPRRSRPRGR